MPKPLVQSTGRRKGAVARVRIRPGTGKITVNQRDFAAYFPSKAHQMILTEPLRLTSTDEVYDIDATMHGGGVSGQASAVVHTDERVVGPRDSGGVEEAGSAQPGPRAVPRPRP